MFCFTGLGAKYRFDTLCLCDGGSSIRSRAAATFKDPAISFLPSACMRPVKSQNRVLRGKACRTVASFAISLEAQPDRTLRVARYDPLLMHNRELAAAFTCARGNPLILRWCVARSGLHVAFYLNSRSRPASGRTNASNATTSSAHGRKHSPKDTQGCVR